MPQSAVTEAHPFLAAYIQAITVSCGLIGVVVRWLIIRKKNPPKKLDLETMTLAFASAANVPVGILLIASSFDTHMFAFLSDLYLALASAGVATLYLAIKGLSS